MVHVEYENILMYKLKIKMLARETYLPRTENHILSLNSSTNMQKV